MRCLDAVFYGFSYCAIALLISSVGAATPFGGRLDDFTTLPREAIQGAITEVTYFTSNAIVTTTIPSQQSSLASNAPAPPSTPSVATTTVNQVTSHISPPALAAISAAASSVTVVALAGATAAFRARRRPKIVESKVGKPRRVSPNTTGAPLPTTPSRQINTSNRNSLIAPADSNLLRRNTSPSILPSRSASVRQSHGASSPSSRRTTRKPHWAFSWLTGVAFAEHERVDMPNPHPEYLVGTDYVARNPDELDLTSGSRVALVVVFRDGWCEVVDRASADRRGLVPMDVLELGFPGSDVDVKGAPT
ncbi:hypothetical protein M427DRAFT_51167 [Gonapodya prolifera JEL478]|uniref:SH3 domain-containing protein n=1 Tax=Gonapodya prolifera (strain JEL478) TaxID=1344416 RepID=A0A139AZ84_GONPJ|nr:hypothetical protein M427DRAFT_51167 [Gonapodya prolifera JEL478]|eukprot:KXS21785.1 hypothetical protein M427DRAFT_51167 [Gonapodya prolifera JEL478]